MNEQKLIPIKSTCSRFVERCAKMFRLDLIEQKYQCTANHDDELDEFWASWSEATGRDYRDLSEKEAIDALDPFRVENTFIVLYRAPFSVPELMCGKGAY